MIEGGEIESLRFYLAFPLAFENHPPHARERSRVMKDSSACRRSAVAVGPSSARTPAGMEL